jgi:hypothetical protein
VTKDDQIDSRGTSDAYGLYVSNDHVRICGGDQVLGRIYAALEWRARKNGPGSTEFMDTNMPNLKKALGEANDCHAETITLSLRKLVQAGLVEEGQRGRCNIWRLKINFQLARELLETWKKSPKKVKEFWSGKRREGQPAPTRKPPKRVYFTADREPEKPPLVHGETEYGSRSPVHGSRSPANPSLDIDYNDVNTLASYRSAAHREPPRRAEFHASRQPAAEKPSPETAPANSGLEAEVRAVTEGVRLRNELNDQTVRNLAAIAAETTAPNPAIESLRTVLNEVQQQHRQMELSWGYVVQEVRKRVAKCAPRLQERPESDEFLPPSQRVSYKPEEIARDPVRRWSLGEIKAEAELDLKRRATSAEHAEAVRARWQLPIYSDVPVAGRFLDPDWVEAWFFFEQGSQTQGLVYRAPRGFSARSEGRQSGEARRHA